MDRLDVTVAGETMAVKAINGAVVKACKPLNF